MKIPFKGAIDCDVHPALPSTKALLPYLDDYWRDQFINRYIDRFPFTLMSYPPTSPLSGAAGLAHAGGPARPAISTRCGRRRSIRSARASPSSIRCTARSRCSTRTWRRRSARR